MRYRDTKTGLLVSESTWKRSKAKGGKRYKRERPKPRRKKRKPLPPIPPPQAGIFEWLVTFSYKSRVKSLDVIATATDEDEAIDKAIEFVKRDRKARQIVAALDKFRVRGKRGRRVKRHHATEWRAKSRA